MPLRSINVEILTQTSLLQAAIEDQEQVICDLANSILSNSKDSGPISALETAIYFLRESLQLRPRLHPCRSESLHHLATALITRFDRTGQVADLEEAIRLRGEFLAAWKSSLKSETDVLYGCAFRKLPKNSQSISEDDRLSSQMVGFAIATLTEFHQAAEISSLNLAIALHRDALRLRGPQHPKYSASLVSLAEGLSERFRCTGQVQDAYEAVLLYSKSFHLQPTSHTNRLASSAFVAALLTRFSAIGQPQDLYSAVSRHHRSQMIGQDDQLEVYGLGYRAGELVATFRHNGQTPDLDAGIWLYRQALVLLSAHDPNRTKFMINLSSALTTRFESAGHRADSLEAIAINREVLKLLPQSHPDISMVLNNLANTLDMRYGQMGQLEDLHEALLLHRDALKCRPIPHPDRAMSLSNLASALGTRFSRMGELADLNEAVKLLREALILRPAPHSMRSHSLNNLATALDTRFTQTGQIDDLDEAISLHREARLLLPPPHPERPYSLINLANALVARFNQTRQQIDLNEAIALFKAALMQLPKQHTSRPGSMSVLGSALSKRSRKIGQLNDLDQAVSLHRESLLLIPPLDPDRPRVLHNLANTLARRFDKKGQIDDLHGTVRLHREALELRPSGHPDRLLSLNELARVLSRRFDYTGEISDLDEALGACRESVHKLPADDPSTCTYAGTLGDVLMSLHSQTQRSDHLDDAMAAFRTAATCKSAGALRRFVVARRWAYHADGIHSSALEAFRTAIQLLPHIAMLGLDLASRHEALSQISGNSALACDAALCAIRSDQLALAIELIEEGRAIFWAQALQLRTPLDDLRLVEPALAQKLENISRALELGSQRENSRLTTDKSRKVMLMEAEEVRYRRLSEDWLQAVTEARRMEGFHNFLRPKKLVDLQKAASNGPVVILIAGNTTSSALIVMPSGVEHILLPDLTHADVKVLARSLQTALSLDMYSFMKTLKAPLKTLVTKSQAYRRISDLSVHPDERAYNTKRRAKRPSEEPDDVFRDILAILWTCVVKPVIQHLALKKFNAPARLWWCQTGSFALLPIHAAGIYTPNHPSAENALDYIVSSYTPTLSSLLALTPPRENQFKMVVAIQPPNSKYRRLPCARDELNKIQQHVPEEYLVAFGVPGAPSSVETITASLLEASIAHFACHGQQDPKRPLESCLLLEDGPLKVSRVLATPKPNAWLIFLSACQTAMGDERLPDEVIHLAASFLFSGFRTAVATMWSIRDKDGPTIADNFYAELFGDKPIGTSSSTTGAAQALHQAVIKLRTECENAAFERWVPFIHLGL